MNLKILKEEQQNLRAELVQIYSTKNISILMLSKDMEMAYTPLRNFLLGSNAHYANLLKIYNWIEKKKK